MPPRRSTRAAPAPAAAPEPARKRRASARHSTSTSGTALKKQKYNPTIPDKSVKSTAKKSKYFGEDESGTPKGKSRRSLEPVDDFISENEDGPDAASPDPDWDSSDAKSSDHEVIEGSSTPEAATHSASGGKRVSAQKRRRGTQPKVSLSSKKKDLWREGVKTGLGPGKEVFIEKPKARDPGDILYQDDTLHPNTLLFLEDLTSNNEREWFKAHDADYRASKKDWDTFVETLTEKVIEKDSTIPELPAKDLVFRIHRDIRFSKDPTPYKTHFSAAWSRTGKKGPYAAYYVHCQPGASFVGCGLWHPEADKLALLREELDRNSHHLKAILRKEGLRREIFDGIPDDEAKSVEAFVSQNSESALKTRPKGYEYDNENIQLLRLRSFTIGTRVPDADLLNSDAQERIATLIGIMEPFVTYLNSVVMPDSAEPDSSIASDSSGDA